MPPEQGSAALRAMFDEMEKAPSLYQPGPFWRELTEVGLRQLDRAGMTNFKRTVNMTYFNWGVLGILHHQLIPVLKAWLKSPTLQVLKARFPDPRTAVDGVEARTHVSDYRVKLKEVASFNRATATIYMIYVAMLYDCVRRIDKQNLLGTLTEPEFGNPFAISYRGCSTSQDLCNSVHEYYSATSGSSPDALTEVAELGPGYGRLAYVYLSAHSSLRYTMIDIPPALHVAQEYASTVYEGESVFYFRPFDSFEDVRDEFEASRIRFLEPHQFRLLPDKYFDLVINVSSLHEMTLDQVTNYLSEIDAKCSGHFYSKQWRRSQAKVNDVVLTEHSYPLPQQWQPVFHRRHPIQRLFFEALYYIGPDSDRSDERTPNAIAGCNDDGDS